MTNYKLILLFSESKVDTWEGTERNENKFLFGVPNSWMHYDGAPDFCNASSKRSECHIHPRGYIFESRFSKKHGSNWKTLRV